MDSRKLFEEYENAVYKVKDYDDGELPNPPETARWISRTTKAELKHIVEMPDPDQPGRNQILSLDDWGDKVKGHASDTDFKNYAVVLRHEIDGEGFTLRNQLELQSQTLRKYFKTLGRQFRHMNVDADPIEILSPFSPLFFLRHELENQEKRENGSALGQEIKLLLDFIGSRDGLGDIVKRYQDLVPHNRISFNMLWCLYPPLELVYHHERDIEQCLLVEYAELVILSGRYMAQFHLVGGVHDGKRFGVSRQILSLPMFAGTVEINPHNLPIIPMRLLKDNERKKIRERLIKRGKYYIQLQTQKYSYLSYYGQCWRPQTTESKISLRSEEMEIETNYRIMIDALAAAELAADLAYGKAGSFIAPNVDEYMKGFLVERKSSGPEERKKGVRRKSMERLETDARRRDTMDMIEELIASRTRLDGVELPEELKPESKNFPITEVDELLCPCRIDAFLLDRKIWIWVLVSNIKPIEWYPDPYAALQLNPQKKALIYALVESFNTKEDAFEGFDDIARGKGKGLIFLLHGEPGVGKTFTAETIAEQTHRPLYHVSAGELKTDIGDMEEELENHFKLGWRWGAVVLIDEADVLMSKRDVHDLKRSSIVAIFLRLIEYYKGLLFLTTNLVENFDSAFTNRIHVTIEYEKPDATSRKNIWRKLLNKRKDTIQLDSSWEGDEVYDILSELEVTGRDIRNLIRTAYGYAKYQAGLRGVPMTLGVRHVRMIIEETCSAKNVDQVVLRLQPMAIRTMTLPLEDAEKPTTEEMKSGP